MATLNEELSGLVTVNLGDPGFGTNAQWMNPEQRRIQIVSFSIKIATNSSTADRVVSLLGFNGTEICASSVSPAIQLKSTTRTYRFAPCQLGFDTGDSAQVMFAPLSSTFFLNPFAWFQTDILDLQGTDMITNAQLAYQITLPR